MKLLGQELSVYLFYMWWSLSANPKLLIDFPSWRSWWLSWGRTHLQCRRPGFHPWVGKIPWRRKWQPTPVFLPRESHGQRSLVGCSPRGHKDVDVRGFPAGSVVKTLPAMQEMPVPSPGQEDPLEKEMATHSSILAWKNTNPWGCKRARHD